MNHSGPSVSTTVQTAKKVATFASLLSKKKNSPMAKETLLHEREEVLKNAANFFSLVVVCSSSSTSSSGKVQLISLPSVFLICVEGQCCHRVKF